MPGLALALSLLSASTCEVLDMCFVCAFHCIKKILCTHLPLRQEKSWMRLSPFRIAPRKAISSTATNPEGCAGSSFPTPPRPPRSYLSDAKTTTNILVCIECHNFVPDVTPSNIRAHNCSSSSQFVELSLCFGKCKSVCLSVCPFAVCLSARLIFSNTFQWPIYKLVTDYIRTTYSTLTDLIY